MEKLHARQYLLREFQWRFSFTRGNVVAMRSVIDVVCIIAVVRVYPLG